MLKIKGEDMNLVEETLESPSVLWKTKLPHVNKSCKSPAFTLMNSEARFTIKGSWSQFEKDETWTVDLSTSLSLGTIAIVAYIEKKNKMLQRFACCVQSRETNGNSYNSILYVTRKNLLDEGLKDDKLSMAFVFHPELYPSKKQEKSYAVRTKRMKLGHLSLKSSCLQALSEDIEMMFDKEEDSDVVLKCAGRSFFVNKHILSARSSVFAAMFRNNMSESTTGLVNITDMNSSVLEQFLRYVYSGKLETLCLDSIIDLYRAGDKYAVSSLKVKCASFMAENLSEVNVCQVLLIADTFRDTELFSVAVDYALTTDEFLGSNTWNEFAKAHPALAVEVYKKFHTK